ncbi:MAG: helix-turn-helix transcriptional regulator [Burkholderiales bacterium]|nr:helix-turn-helix transcriptional regulator [Burkholderiales bacterium]MDE2076889.1 helix-turn-helix transcriptional regulator [Burkholderiales bacterium]MDE2431791.1 helix-turn-helix transcriptional regulator [Burkholderiales bacterium]
MNSDTLLQTLGDSLREARRQRGYTQDELARMLNIPRLKVIQVESGAPQVAVRYYTAIASALGQSVGLIPAKRPTLDELQKLNRS